MAKYPALDDTPPIERLDQLPSYAFSFFFRNLGPFRTRFLLLTAVSVLDTGVRFFSVYLLGDIISTAATLTTDQILYFYLPAWLGTALVAEGLEFLTRRYGEELPARYGEHLSLRFYLSILRLDFRNLFNVSKERLNVIVGRYVANVQHFVSDWIWGVSMRGTRLIIVVTILAWQNPYVLLINAIYVVFFLAIALRLSSKFSAVAQRYTEQAIETSSINASFIFNLNTVRRLGLRDFFRENMQRLLSLNWDRLVEVRRFHAWRWLIQLSLFEVLYIGTLLYGAYQVKIGAVSLGFLVLLKWAFDELAAILIYVVEQYVSMVQQRADAVIVREEFKSLMGGAATNADGERIGEWNSLRLSDLKLEFTPAQNEGRRVTISVPELAIERRQKIGIIGESGAGKSSILGALLGVLPFQGSYTVDGRDARALQLDNRFVTVINHAEPLFKISLRDNILLGRDIAPDRVDRILHGVRLTEVVRDLDAVVGSAGVNLSTGQEQRVRLARGLLQESSMYLLDEPFNGIDERTKNEIIAFLREELSGKSVVLVTHNRSELSLVDTVYKLENGVLSSAS